LSKTCQSLSRREFAAMAARSAAIAAPFVMNMAGNIAEAKAAEETTPGALYYINDNCILCPPYFPCKNACTVNAIHYDGEKFAIDTKQCIRCGKCAAVCEIGAIVDANAAPPVYKPHDIIFRECDFLVLGSGSSGLVAAAIAADLSSKGNRIIVLEKAQRPGGSSFYAQGIRFFATKWQRDAGDPDQMENYLQSAMDKTRWELNPKLVASSFRALPHFFDWFCTWGKAEEIWSMVDSSRVKGRKNIVLKNQLTERSRSFAHRLLDRCTKLGVEILTEHAATEFIMGDKGEITGVVAKDPGGTTIITCKYCLVATGNLTNCDSLLARSNPQYVNSVRERSGHRLPTNTGDGVLMAEKAGIPIDYDNICELYTGPNSTHAEAQLMGLDQRGEGLYVNLKGERWVNEGYVQMDVERGFFPVLRRQPRCMFYSVMDSKTIMMDPLPMRRITSEPGIGPSQAVLFDDEPAQEEKTTRRNHPNEKPNLKELQRIASLKGRHLIIADTIEELAEKMGVDQKVFVDTVKHYNELCGKGQDVDFFKPVEYLLAIEKAPFFASSHFLGTDGAFGGLMINENMQVIGLNGPIDNLYAAGDTTGGNFISRDGERCAILPTNSWAVASGFVAGESVGKRLRTGRL
jgi:fumarate reductase flavoprotein subunit